jgi:hypothetical protein
MDLHYSMLNALFFKPYFIESPNGCLNGRSWACFTCTTTKTHVAILQKSILAFNERLGQHDGHVMGWDQHMEIHCMTLCAKFWLIYLVPTLM